jgi:hypothetical protein
MLGKLLKYEMKALGRVFLPVYGALIILSIINKIFIALNMRTLIGIGTGIMGMLVGGIAVLTLVLTLQRFRRNLLGNEGYLMFTLPVSVDSLIFSKMIAALIWGIFSLIALTISGLILAANKDMNLFQAISDLVRLIKSINISGGDLALLIVEGCLFALMSVFSAIILFYACMSLSMLVNKRRGLFTFGAFIVITVIWQIIASAVSKLIPDISSLYMPIAQMHWYAWIAIGGETITFLTLYFVTRYMLSRRLNIE